MQPLAAGAAGAAVFVIALLWHDGFSAEHTTMLGAAPLLWAGVFWAGACAGEAPDDPKLPAPA
jgi:hypothetical protein